jgi:lysozyme
MAHTITPKIAMELVSHEAIVTEAYKDSVGVWTWSVGITDSSGHTVYPRYKDNPQTLKRCLEVFEWVVRNKYMPKVDEVFAGHSLSEAQVGAALSFHYNTGRLHTASWPKLWKQGDIAGARVSIMNWRNPPEIIPRREKERDLFFDGIWSNNGTALVIPVRKPSYTPNFSGADRVEIMDILQDLFG